jgi:hypothetical protein
MDERYDTVRAIRDKQFRYVRNYSPHRPWGQHYSYPFQVMPSMRSWYEAFRSGQCNTVQARYWQPKPSEELYDTVADPHEVQNLADDPRYAMQRDQMRRLLRADLLAIRDTGFISEGMFERLAGGKTIYDYAQSDAYPIERIVDLANRASSRDRAALADLQAALQDPHPVIRYWGAVGCLVLQDQSQPAKTQLKDLLKDEWPDVRIAAAEALCYLGEADAALASLQSSLSGQGQYEVLAALNALDFMQAAGKVSRGRVQEMLQPMTFPEPSSRIAAWLLEPME